MQAFSLLNSFPEQIKDALKIASSYNFSFSADKIIFCGMGGSGISGEILKNFSNVPFIAVKDYNLPYFADSSTLLIAMSYSGNTSEVISCYKEAKKKGCKILAVTSGGILSKEKNSIILPAGMPPRFAIAYLLFTLALTLENNGLIKKQDYEEIITVTEIIRDRMKEKGNIAEEIAKKIKGIPLIYGYAEMASIAKRWRQQLNENAKMLAFDFQVSECNHNEIEAWERDLKNLTCIFLRGNENEEVKKRFDFMKRKYGEKAIIIEYFAEGKSLFAKMISSLYIGDYVSLYKANLDGFDPIETKLIKELKKELASKTPQK
ncbi:MAG: bifunctional phosphoglucose/phosphomannose isomerase [Thermoplasmatales archaeon]|nr:bifunctional phosphoglucose/phosphomannose isomerase [Thermoplasmatales archaeon]